MSAKHTPGPWSVVGREKTTVIAAGPEGFMVAETQLGEMGIQVCRANARLIAAAPDLLEALEVLLTAVNVTTRFGAEKEAARAAIAKARGES